MMQEESTREASGYLGMTVRTLETVYGYYRPTHLSKAKGFVNRNRANREQANGLVLPISLAVTASQNVGGS
jgi:hypothetical protein